MHERRYRVRAHLHHYTEYMEQAQVQQAIDNIGQLVADYDNLSRFDASGVSADDVVEKRDFSGGSGGGGGRRLASSWRAELFDDADLDLAPIA